MAQQIMYNYKKKNAQGNTIFHFVLCLSEAKGME